MDTGPGWLLREKYLPSIGDMKTKLAKFRDLQFDVSGERVGICPREFFVFDNFSAFQVDWHGRMWATSEHAYQAAKFFETARDVVEEIFNARSPHRAKEIASSHEDECRSDWADVKVTIMTDILRHKLEQHPYVSQKLRQTLDLEIVEDSPQDSFWGWGPHRNGRNELGKIWMRLREELMADS